MFKEQPLKPCILTNVLGVLGTRKFKKGQYVSEEDFVVLEDQSGRIRVKKTDKFNPGYFVTGSNIALKGVSDTNGFFHVEDFCYAGISFSQHLPKTVKHQRELYDAQALQSDQREFVGFLSGLEFGLPGDTLSSEMLLRFVRGELGSTKDKLVNKALIICYS